jgi:hypothetical protein
MAAFLFATPNPERPIVLRKPFIRAAPLAFPNHWHSSTFARAEKKLKVGIEKVLEGNPKRNRRGIAFPKWRDERCCVIAITVIQDIRGNKHRRR